MYKLSLIGCTGITDVSGVKQSFKSSKDIIILIIYMGDELEYDIFKYDKKYRDT